MPIIKYFWMRKIRNKKNELCTYDSAVPGWTTARDTDTRILYRVQRLQPSNVGRKQKISLNKYRPLTLFLVKFSSFQDMKSRFHCNANKLVEILISKKHFPGANRGYTCRVEALKNHERRLSFLVLSPLYLCYTFFNFLHFLQQKKVIDICMYIFLAIFTIEMFVKVNIKHNMFQSL